MGAGTGKGHALSFLLHPRAWTSKQLLIKKKNRAHLLSVVLFCLLMHVPLRLEAVIKILIGWCRKAVYVVAVRANDEGVVAWSNSVGLRLAYSTRGHKQLRLGGRHLSIGGGQGLARTGPSQPAAKCFRRHGQLELSPEMSFGQTVQMRWQETHVVKNKFWNVLAGGRKHSLAAIAAVRYRFSDVHDGLIRFPLFVF